MFLKDLFGPRICYGSAGGSSGGSSSGSSGGRNRDADAFAGSRYKPAKKSSGNSGKGSSSSSVTAKNLANNNVSTYKNSQGGSLTVSRGTSLQAAPTVNVGVNGGATRSNEAVYGSKDVAGPTQSAPVQGGGSSAPVTAPERIDAADGVGGGRDGGGSARRKASKTSEDNVQIKRAAEGVDRYKTAKSKAKKANPMAIAAKRKA